jgi:hypothetical protein
MSMSSTFLVFDSQADFKSNNTRLRFSDCYMQSRLNWRHYQFFLFGGDAAGLRVAIHYGASKCYAPTRNLATHHWNLLWCLFVGITFLSKNFEPNCHFDGFLLPLNTVWESSTLLDATSSLRKIVVSFPQKPIRSSSSSKPCQLIVSSESFQGWLPVAPLSPTLS